jgi:hypothetical protein
MHEKQYWQSEIMITRYERRLIKARKLGILPFPPNTFPRKARKMMTNATPANIPIIIANVFSPSLVFLSAFGGRELARTTYHEMATQLFLLFQNILMLKLFTIFR